MPTNKTKQIFAVTSGIALLLIVELFSRLPDANSLNDWCTTPYAFNYHFGMHSRFLMGSIFQWLLSPISLHRLYLFILLSTLILIGLFAYFYAKTITAATDKATIGITYWTILLMASPASIAFLFYWGNYGRMDLYLIGILFIALSIADKRHLNNMIPALLLIGMAVHQVFLFTYCAVILGVLLYECYRSQFHRGDVIRLISGIVIAATAFLYFQFGTSPLYYESAGGVVEILNQQSNIPVNEKMIEYEYFKSLSEHMDAFVKVDLKDRVIRGIIVLILMMPINIFIWRFWHNTAKLHITYRLLSLTPLAILPAFILTIDWGRWFAAVYIAAFSLIAYLFKRKDPVAEIYFEKLSEWIQKQPLLAFGVLVYFVALNKFEAAAILNYATHIHLFLQKIF
ncbi:hypothetical protein KHM83_08915 [Fusibacter paucivorans]|uniref:EpsG family protein n=1 Tax=Fusibacter paucivorans TaxID=76009 RepID=A0ABS5PPE2_9FIRM|nr:hypothetical protein [Fusibacter paucivorans]MBS7526797.1 hypothetical protein [Fusibacter paucivorans]